MYYFNSYYNYYIHVIINLIIAKRECCSIEKTMKYILQKNQVFLTEDGVWKGVKQNK